MNIQLRDSQSLQTAIKANKLRTENRTQVHKAQLHPQLLNGIVECDREGFSIRTEFLTGDHRGDVNPQDVQNLKDFLPEPRECEARWTNVTLKQGDSSVAIPSELVFVFSDSSKLVIHTQAVSDTTKLTSALPSDQSARFTATPGVGRIDLVRVGAARPQAAPPISDADLQTYAGIYGVKWDKTASRETMMARVAEAREAKEKKDAEPKTPAKTEKKELQSV